MLCIIIKELNSFQVIICESFVSSVWFGDGQNFIIGLIHHHLRNKISNKCCRTSRQSLSLRYKGMWISTHILQLKLIFLRFSCRSVKFIDVYRHRLAARQAACTNRKFHGNRVLPRVLWRSLTERILINHYIYIMGHKLSHARDVSGSCMSPILINQVHIQLHSNTESIVIFTGVREFMLGSTGGFTLWITCRISSIPSHTASVLVYYYYSSTSSTIAAS